MNYRAVPSEIAVKKVWDGTVHSSHNYVQCHSFQPYCTYGTVPEGTPRVLYCLLTLLNQKRCDKDFWYLNLFWYSRVVGYD